MYDITVILAQLALIIVVARLAGYAAGKVGIPPVVGEIAAGVLLGPSLLGPSSARTSSRSTPGRSCRCWRASAWCSSCSSSASSSTSSWSRVAGGSPRSVSVTSILLPFSLGIGLAALLNDDLRGADGDFLPFALFVGAAMSITAFPVLARILTDRRMHRTQTGGLALACAATDDVLAWTLLAVVIGIAGGEGAERRLGRVPRDPVRAGRAVRGPAGADGPHPDARQGGRAHARPSCRSCWSGCCCSPRRPSTSACTTSSARSSSARSSRTSRPRRCATRSWCGSSSSRSLLLLPVFFLTSGLKVDIRGLGPRAPPAAAGDPRRRDRRQVRRRLRRRPLGRRAPLAGQRPRHPDEHPRPDRADHPQHRAGARADRRRAVHDDGDHGAGHHGDDRSAARAAPTRTAGSRATSPRPSAPRSGSRPATRALVVAAPGRTTARPGRPRRRAAARRAAPEIVVAALEPQSRRLDLGSGLTDELAEMAAAMERQQTLVQAR